VNALGRRYPDESGLNLRVGDLTLDLNTHDVYRGGERIDLSPRELMLLKVLMREPGRVFTRTELCERVWEHVHEYDTKLVEVFIGRLRKKIGDPPLIHTVRHVGYTTCESPWLPSVVSRSDRSLTRCSAVVDTTDHPIGYAMHRSRCSDRRLQCGWQM
jgi:DNA-binding response OmpR family regulator